MTDIEIPLGKRTKKYRFYEMLPAILSYGAVILLIVLSLIDPLLAALYLVTVIITTLIKAIGIAVHTIRGRNRLESAQKVNWRARLDQLEDPKAVVASATSLDKAVFGQEMHLANCARIVESPEKYPAPSQIYNVVIIAAYNESLEVLEPTLQSVAETTYDNSRLIVVLAYEERGGSAIESTAQLLQKKYKDTFHSFQIVCHPKDLAGEVVGKGGNITHAGRYIASWLKKQHISYSDVIVTTLDSDNRPHRTYFDYVTYEYIVRTDRKKLSYQPISLFLNNIWDAPAPMRVVATGNSFWNVVLSLRPHMLRNFSSHAQPMSALIETDFWSVRTIVEDGHQYWRSFFRFDRKYNVFPIFVPIYQDAVLTDSYRKTLRAQFKQVQRWAWGASDIAYVFYNGFLKKNRVPRPRMIAKFARLLENHVSWSVTPLILLLAAWPPFF